MTNTHDQTVLNLIKKVEDLQAEIKTTEKYSWKTNCFYKTYQTSVNLQVESDVGILCKIAGELMTAADGYDTAIAVMELENPEPFKVEGFVLQDWMDDIRARINKIQLTKKKNRLKELEARLNSIMSPELKAKLELEKIQKELG